MNYINLDDINEQQQKEIQINFEKTILQYDDDNDDDSLRPTFNDIIKLDDVEISFLVELEDDEYNENNINQQIENDINHENPIIQPDDNHSDVVISKNTSETIKYRCSYNA